MGWLKAIWNFWLEGLALNAEYYGDYPSWPFS